LAIIVLLPKERREKKSKKQEQNLLVHVTQYPLKASLIVSCNLNGYLRRAQVIPLNTMPLPGLSLSLSLSLSLVKIFAILINVQISMMGIS
jgi:hypothetical protein